MPTVAERTEDLMNRNILPLSVTAMNLTCLDHSAWKSFNRVREGSFVSVSLLKELFSLNWIDKERRIWQFKCDLFVFPGDGRWRHVIRRCASVAESGKFKANATFALIIVSWTRTKTGFCNFFLGVTDVCNWGVYENGDYWEECYCSHDGCNGSNQNRISTAAVIVSTIFTLCLAVVTARN